MEREFLKHGMKLAMQILGQIFGIKIARQKTCQALFIYNNTTIFKYTNILILEIYNIRILEYKRETTTVI